MKLIPLVFILIFFSFSYSQSTHFAITGKVIDKNSKQLLAGASVFAQNTTFGIATDAEGSFNSCQNVTI